MLSFDSLTFEHWPQVKAIYEEGIRTGNATFETTAPEWEEWNSSHVESCRIIAKYENEITGWAAVTAVSGRCVCRRWRGECLCCRKISRQGNRQRIIEEIN